MDIQNIINNFMINEFRKLVNLGYIYNEFSLQHELGIYLFNTLNKCSYDFSDLDKDYKVYFEKNINQDFVKHEMDIKVEDKNGKYVVIELKYANYGQVPYQLYQFVKDIKFMEQVKELDNCIGTYVLALMDTNTFSIGKGRSNETKWLNDTFSKEDIIVKAFNDNGKKYEYSVPVGEKKGSCPFKLDKDHKFKTYNNGEYRYYFGEIK